MKPLTRTIMLVALFATSSFANAQTHVNGHFRRDGTYVQPHQRTSPDNNIYNNWSTQGNTNPYTGQAGTLNPFTRQQQYLRPYRNYGN